MICVAGIDLVPRVVSYYCMVYFIKGGFPIGI